jgi:predicted cupin superfamily sugar epimerase
MARTTGEYTLVGCTVGPGFEYEDYRLLRDMPEEASEIRRRFPELAEFVWQSQ